MNYKLPRLKAIKTMIAGPDVITRAKAISWNNVVALNILTSMDLINCFISLITWVEVKQKENKTK